MVKVMDWLRFSANVAETASGTACGQDSYGAPENLGPAYWHIKPLGQ